MEVRRQQCQACGSRDLRNIIVRESDLPDNIYCRCAKCGDLVARYVLREYYHHGKGIESYLRSQGVSSGDSGREWLRNFEQTQREAVEGYKRVLDQLREQNKDV